MIPPLSIANVNATVIKWAVVAVLILTIALVAYSHGRHVAEGEFAQEQIERSAANLVEIAKAQTIADQLAADLAALRQAQAPKDRIITKEIIKYESATPAGQRCTLPGRFRVLHDAAATGDATAAETGPVATPAPDPVEDTALLQTLGENYTACRETAARLAGWQRRYHQLEERAP